MTSHLVWKVLQCPCLYKCLEFLARMLIRYYSVVTFHKKTLFLYFDSKYCACCQILSPFNQETSSRWSSSDSSGYPVYSLLSYFLSFFWFLCFLYPLPPPLPSFCYVSLPLFSFIPWPCLGSFLIFGWISFLIQHRGFCRVHVENSQQVELNLYTTLFNQKNLILQTHSQC